jgi:hypothetical protein
MRNLRADMPQTAAWIDELREAFGREMVDAQIKRAMKGEKTFYAKEGTHEFGTQITELGVLVSPHIPPKAKGKSA